MEVHFPVCSVETAAGSEHPVLHAMIRVLIIASAAVPVRLYAVLAWRPTPLTSLVPVAFMVGTPRNGLILVRRQPVAIWFHNIPGSGYAILIPVTFFTTGGANYNFPLFGFFVFQF
jgi:hypothetical protein